MNVILTLRFCGPDNLGGLGDIPTKARILAEETGRNEEDITNEVCIFLLLTGMVKYSQTGCRSWLAQPLERWLPCLGCRPSMIMSGSHKKYAPFPPTSNIAKHASLV
jgi:hypothetical protein